MKVQQSFTFSALGLLVALVLTCVGIWTFGSGASAQAPPTRIAVIDVQKVLSQSNAGKAAYAKLKQLQEARIAKAKTLDDELRKLNNEINANRATLSAAKLADLQLQAADKRRAMQRYAEDADKELASARERELQALDLRIKAIVNGIGREMALAAIFNKFESGLIYTSDLIDVTDKVISRFNAATPTQPAAPGN